MLNIEQELINAKALLEAIYGTNIYNISTISAEDYKKYLNIKILEMIKIGGMISDFRNSYEDQLVQKRTNDILDGTNFFNEEFVFSLFSNIAVKVCKKEPKDLKFAIKFLYVLIEDKKIMNTIHTQMNYIDPNYQSKNDFLKNPHQLHLTLLHSFAKKCH